MRIEKLIRIIADCGYSYGYSSIDNILKGYVKENTGHRLDIEIEAEDLQKGLTTFVKKILFMDDKDKYCYIKFPKECFGVVPVADGDLIRMDHKFYNPHKIEELNNMSTDEAKRLTQQIDKNGDFLSDEVFDAFKNWISYITDEEAIIIYNYLNRFGKVVLIDQFRSLMAVGEIDDYTNISCETRFVGLDDMNYHLNAVLEKFWGISNGEV